MKKIKYIFEFILIFLLGFFIGLNFFSQYDSNRDGKVSPSDYVAIKNYIMGKGGDE